MMIVNDDSRVVNKLEASLTDNARVIIYDRHMFIVQATGQFQANSTEHVPFVTLPLIQSYKDILEYSHSFFGKFDCFIVVNNFTTILNW
jgi:hypothetical protein